MPQFDPRTLSSMSDEDLLALELDKDLPIEEWMQVERERGRREERCKREAERARMTPSPPGMAAAPIAIGRSSGCPATATTLSRRRADGAICSATSCRYEIISCLVTSRAKPLGGWFLALPARR